MSKICLIDYQFQHTYRLMELLQTGLMDYWEIWFRPMPRQCKGKIKSGYTPPDNNRHPPLSLKNLTGAFIVLLVGLSISFLAYLCEKIVFVSDRHRRQLRLQTSTEKLSDKFVGEVAQVFTDWLFPQKYFRHNFDLIFNIFYSTYITP